MILMWSCPGNMPKYYSGMRDILPYGSGNMSRTWVIFWHITWKRPHYCINIAFAASAFVILRKNT